MSEKQERIIFDVAYQPQVRTNMDTRRIMINVMIALLPAFGVSIWQFGWKAVLLVIASMSSAVFWEWLYRKLLKKPSSIGDCSAALTGLLLAMTLPASAPWWLPVIGTFFAIVIVKQLYGGIGKNFLNPALAARAFLIASYSLKMTSWSVPNSLAAQVDGVTMATPMSYLYSGQPMPVYLSMKNMFFGMMPGCIGEISVLALLIGAAYLMIRKIITWRIPVSFIGTVCLLNLIFGHALPRRLLHGNRLCHHPCHSRRPHPLRRGLRHRHGPDPVLRQLSRGRKLRHPHHEPLCMGHGQGLPQIPVRRFQGGHRGNESCEEGGGRQMKNQSSGGLIFKLSVILLIVAGVLGVINEITWERIAEQKREKTYAAYAAVLPADAYEPVEFDKAQFGTIDKIEKASDGEGYVVQTTFSGAQGKDSRIGRVGLLAFLLRDALPGDLVDDAEHARNDHVQGGYQRGRNGHQGC